MNTERAKKSAAGWKAGCFPIALSPRRNTFIKRTACMKNGSVRCSLVNAFYEELRKIEGFKRILKEGDVFTPISKEEAAFIAGITDEDYSIGMSEGYILDSKVYITSGPLLGREGIIKKIDRHKRTAVIELTFLGQPQLVRMPLEVVSKL